MLKNRKVKSARDNSSFSQLKCEPLVGNDFPQSLLNEAGKEE